MIKSTLAIICLVSLSFVTWAQEELVTKIRKTYTDYNNELEQYMSEGLDFMPQVFRIKTVQMRPALGPVEIEISYFFDEQTLETENPDNNSRNTKGVLRKIVYKEAMPSFTEYRELFYDTSGKLLFYYAKSTGSICGEKRVYFNQLKMVKIKFNPVTGKECPDENDPFRLMDFTRYPGKYTKDDLEWEKWILGYAGTHAKAFQNLFLSLQ
jgi:hypothetical protein